MTWTSAIIPASDVASANGILEANGYGPNNFSVPLWRGDEPDPDSFGLNIAAPDAAFIALVQGLPGVSLREATSGQVEFDQHVAAEGLKREPTVTVDQELPSEDGT